MNDGNLVIIRELIDAAFNMSELNQFVSIHFKDVYARYVETDRKDVRISRLVEMADRRGAIAYLVDLIAVENPGKFAEFVDRLTKQVTKQPDEPTAREPFKGLNYFDVDDTDLFFGREQLTAKLVAQLQKQRFLAVIGASGAGKSSVVRAGVVPALQRGATLADDNELPEGSGPPKGSGPPEGSQHWPIHIITPTSQPIESLAISLTRNVESMTATSTLMKDLVEDALSLHLYTRRLLNNSPAQSLLLIIDQFEELFTQCEDEKFRKAFVDNLMTAIHEPDGPLRVIVTLRADFYHHCAQYDQLREALAKQQEFIGKMSEDELRQSIVAPAEANNWHFQAGLVDLFLREVGNEPGALPLLSHALLETWKRREGRVMTLAGYEDAGGIHGAIAKTADTTFLKLEPDQQMIAKSIFIRLTELGEGIADTRRRAARAEFQFSDMNTAQIETVIQVLADARLVTTREQEVEVSHEALIQEWPRLRRWLDANRDGLRAHRRLTDASQEWLAQDKDPAYLYRGSRLEETEKWASSDDVQLSDLEALFLQAGIAERERLQLEVKEQQNREEKARQRELEQQRALANEQQQRAEEQAQAAKRQTLLSRIAFGVGGVALILAVVAVVFAIRSNTNALRAEEEAHKATSRGLAVASDAQLDQDQDLALALAMYATAEAHTKEAENALREGLRRLKLDFTFVGHTGEVLDVAFTSDGTLLITAGSDGVIKVWDVQTGEEAFSLTKHTGAVQGITVDPEGTVLASASADNTVRIWDVRSGQELAVITGHSDAVLDVTFNHDGTLLGTASQDNTIKVWDVASSQEVFMINNSVRARSLDFSANEAHLATAWDDGTVQIWDIMSQSKIAELSGHEKAINHIEYSDDQKLLVTVSDDENTIIWDAISGEEIETLEDEGFVYGAKFYDPTGKYLATSNANGSVKFWHLDVNADKVQEKFKFSNDIDTENNWINRIEFSPDGARIAVSSKDGIVKLWSIFGDIPMVLRGHTDRVRDVKFSPDGQYLGTASWDKTAKLWNTQTGQALSSFDEHSSFVLHVAFHPDSSQIATTSHDAARVWDLSSNEKLFTLSNHLGNVHDVTYSPDGKLLVTTDLSGTIKIWDTNSGQEVRSLAAHEVFVSRVSFNLDGTLMATASHDNTAKVWDTATWGTLKTLEGHTEGVESAVFSPDGRFLVTAGLDNTAKLWDASSGDQLLTFIGHSQDIGDVVFSPNGIHIATASEDKTARVWDITTGEELLIFNHFDGVNELAFSPDGARLAVASHDGLVFIHTVNINELLSLGARRLNRPLLSNECQKFLRQSNCPPLSIVN